MCLYVGYPEQPTQAELEADIDCLRIYVCIGYLILMIFSYVFVCRVNPPNFLF